ncbi:MAG: hypothetical protein ABEH86_11505 [Haloarcula sp.]
MSDDETDPFEELDAVDDREGDPFERLAEETGANDRPADDTSDSDMQSSDVSAAPEQSGTPSESRNPRDDDWPGIGNEEVASAASGESDQGKSDPSDDILSAIDTEEFRSEQSTDPDGPLSGMDDRGEDPFGSGESVFERVDVDHVDADQVWAELAEDATASDTEESRYTDVSKHRYCEQCEFFSEPPNAHCTNDGTEIREFIDMETVRLLNCPVVAEQHEIDGEQ